MKRVLLNGGMVVHPLETLPWSFKELSEGKQFFSFNQIIHIIIKLIKEDETAEKSSKSSHGVTLRTKDIKVVPLPRDIPVGKIGWFYLDM